MCINQEHNYYIIIQMTRRREFFFLPHVILCQTVVCSWDGSNTL